MRARPLCLFVVVCLIAIVPACGDDTPPRDPRADSSPSPTPRHNTPDNTPNTATAAAHSAAAAPDTAATAPPPATSTRDDGDPVHPAIVGTWAETVSLDGQTLTVCRRFDARKQYRGWFAERPADPGLFGRVETVAGTIHITTVDLNELAVRYRVVDRDTMRWTMSDGRQSTLRRMAAPPASPSAATDGAGLTAADRRDRDKCFAEAQRLFHAGEVDLAVAWFARAAELGHVTGQLQLGWHHELGIGSPRDYARAAHWYRRAAESGDPRAMVALGRMHERGRGVKEDWLAAAQLWHKAAELGHAEALHCMGEAYRYGIGVPQDRRRAVVAFQQAAARGHTAAAHEARWLSDPTNYVGFMSDRERATVLGARLPSAGTMLGGDPAGQRFANSLDRLAWMTGFAARVDADEAEAARARDRLYAELQARRAEIDQRREDKVRAYQSNGYTRTAAEQRADREGY